MIKNIQNINKNYNHISIVESWKQLFLNEHPLIYWINKIIQPKIKHFVIY